jgi:hypothetical protein
MFCHEFEQIAGDLATARLMEAGKRQRALRHASECSACALRLSAERTIEAGLQALRVGAEEGDAPPHLKTALRAAFDRQVKAASVAAGATAAPVLISAPVRSRNLALRWLAAAALILIAAGAGLLSRAISPNSTEDLSGGRTSAPPEQSPPRVVETGESGDQKPKIETNVVGKSNKRRAPRRAAASDSDDTTSINETVTDYIPLTYLADATAMESGTVLRVELPPSVLGAMGLPSPSERTDSRVKADLIIGDDGVPRAVRFVGQDSVRR